MKDESASVAEQAGVELGGIRGEFREPVSTKITWCQEVLAD